MLKCKCGLYNAIFKFNIYFILVNRTIEFIDKTIRK